MTARVKVLLGVIGLLGLLALGIVARSAMITRHDLHVDCRLSELRFPAGTEVALGLTAAASEAVGLAILAVGLLVLVVRRRRWDAVRLAAAVGGSWTLGIAVKALIDRTRPPASLWLLPPDSAASFPSGHDTTACAVVLVALLVLRGTGRLRVAGLTAALGYAAAVGASRVYLGDHYPTDVLGSWLTVASAALLVWAITDLGIVRRAAAAVLRERIPSPAPARPVAP